MCGAVAAGRLVAVILLRRCDTCMGTSPAPANVAGSVKVMMSNPGISRFGWIDKTLATGSAVVPTVIVVSAGVAKCIPVTLSSSRVAT